MARWSTMKVIFAVIISACTIGWLINTSFFERGHDVPRKPVVEEKPVESPFSKTASWQQDYTNQPDGKVDTSIWNLLTGNNNGWGNNELQTYTANQDNVRIQGGALVIEAKKTAKSYSSARITTEGNFDFKYGKIDIVAKLPTGKGTWPAMWFLPSEYKYSAHETSVNGDDISWLSNGEMDMVEGSAQGDNEFSSSAHSLAHYPGLDMRTKQVTVDAPSTSFHTYSLQWTPEKLEFLVDNKVFHTIENEGKGFRDWPYDQKFHLIMNVAMGGTMSEELKSEEMPNGVDDTGSPWFLRVQSITYYPLKEV